MSQKFKKNDLVHIAKDLGTTMSHFPADKDVVIVASYAEQYGGEDTKSYTVMDTKTGGKSSWYREHQLTFVRHLSDEEVGKIVADAEQLSATQSEPAWICANWKFFVKDNSIPGPTIAKLMELVGIEDPWGRSGEGWVYAENAYGTIRLLRKLLDAGDASALESFCADFRAAGDEIKAVMAKGQIDA